MLRNLPMTIYQILSEDHVVEALTRYLREPPFKLDFDKLQIDDINLDFEGDYKFNLTLTVGSGNES
jgi:hypothetical protein